MPTENVRPESSHNTQTTQAASDVPELISTKEAARILRVSGETVRRWSQAGHLKDYRINRRRGRHRFSKRQVLHIVRHGIDAQYQEE